MTQVYVTPGGQKYHADTGCQSLLDVERNEERSVTRRQVELRGLDRQPCSVCWPRTTSNDAWNQLAREVERQGDSEFEVTFVEQVLRQVRGLNPSDVETQVPATGRSGKRYWIDFVLSPPNGVRLAVEIDGRDKDPGTRTPDEVLRAVEAKRADLTSAWQLLNFRNDQVAGRSSQCAEEVRSALFVPVPGRTASFTNDAPHSNHAERTRVATSSGVGGNKRGWLVAVGATVATVGALMIWQLTFDDTSDPDGGDCSDASPIKGNVSQSGEKIYHEPGWTYYSRTSAEECFETADDAMDAGYRESEIR